MERILQFLKSIRARHYIRGWEGILLIFLLLAMLENPVATSDFMTNQVLTVHVADHFCCLVNCFYPRPTFFGRGVMASNVRPSVRLSAFPE